MMQKIDSAWNFIWDKLFCPKTNLFYDYLADGKDATSCLPMPEEIAMQFPNPCGWGTGMEDCMMSAGNMLETVLNRCRLEHDPVLAEMAHNIFKGMKLCATVSRSPGFLARSVSPVDGHSHYINSSRDQYTHYIYAARKFFYSELSSDEEKIEIRKILASFADKALRDVTPENHFCLTREDGRPGVVTQMCSCRTHEIMRLPMFYLAAWDVTGDEKYHIAYQNVIDEALSVNLTHDFTKSWKAYELLQMQYSLRLVFDLEHDEKIKGPLLKLMRDTADFSQKYVLDALQMLHQGTLKPDAVNRNWRNRAFSLYEHRLIDGYSYFVANHDKTYAECCFEPLRAAGQGIIVQQLCPDWSVPVEQYEALNEIVENIDFGKISSYFPILLICAWFGRAA